MKMESLITLRAAVERGSFAAAAEAVNLSPSAVSLQMKQLEVYFGHSLFDRSGRNVRATPFAKQVVDTVERTLGELEGLRSQRYPSPTGRVRLGITGSIQTTLLPKAIAELQKRTPGITLQLERANTPEMLSAIKADRLDAAVVVRPPGGGSSRLHWTDLVAEPLRLIVPSQLQRKSALEYLRNDSWIRLDRRLVVGRMAARYVDSLVPQKEAILDVPSVDAIVVMVGMGLGVSVLPKLKPQQLAVYPIQEVSFDDAPSRILSMVRKKNDTDSPLLNTVEAAFLKACP